MRTEERSCFPASGQDTSFFHPVGMLAMFVIRSLSTRPSTRPGSNLIESGKTMMVAPDIAPIMTLE